MTLSSISVLFNLKIAKYISTAASTLYFYDLMLTWDKEVTLFWNGRGGLLVRTLFLVNRYLPIIGFSCSLADLNGTFSSQLGCRLFLVLISACQVLGISVSTAIFCLRACTIHQYVPAVQCILIVSYWASAVLLLTSASIIVALMMPNIKPSHESCILEGSTRPGFVVTATAFLAPLLCESVIIIATAKHAFDTRQIRKELHMSSASPALRRLYHDGLLHFILVFTLRLLSCLEWYFCRESLKNVTRSLEYSLTSVLTSRFFFALRQSLTTPDLSNDTTDLTDDFDTMESTVEFRLPEISPVVQMDHFEL